MPKAYLSSTSLDLQPHRAVAANVLKRFGYEDVAMESYPSEDQRPLDKCLEDVARCELFVGIYAWRHGSGITAAEYERAVKLGKPRLLFIIDEEAPWPPKWVDRDQKMADFHQLVRHDRLTATFSTPDTLAAHLSAALETHGSRTVNAPGLDFEAYAKFLRRRYNVLDLDALTDPKRDELLQLRVQAIFVEQSAREDAPPLELPKEALDVLAARADIHADDLPTGMTSEALQELKAAYSSRPARPVLEILSAEAHPRTIILGDPGAGKSTLLRYILLSLLDAVPNARLQPALAGRVPFLVDLKTYASLRGQRKCETLFDYFDAIAKSDNAPANGATVRRYLDAGLLAVLLFDGIDEIFEPAEQETITRQIAELAEAYPAARVIVTSRVIGYRRTLLTQAGFRHFTLQDLDEQQVTDFVTQWYALTLSNRPDEAKARVDRIRKSFAASSSIRQLAGNPMLLTIMAIIGKHQELPRERWKLYDHATSVLVQHWDVHRYLVNKDLDPVMDEDDKKELLRRLAWAMQRGEGGLAGNYIHAEELQREFEAYLKERYYGSRPDQAKITARAMIAQFRERNFILSFYGANVYGFVHRAFLEFFCASAIVTKFEKTKELSIEDLKEDVFGAHWQEKAWQEVLRLVCGMIGEEFAGELIEYLRAGGGDEAPGRVALAVACLSEVRRIELVAETAEKLLETLMSASESEVGLAIDSAVEIGVRWPGREHLMEWIGKGAEDFAVGEVVGSVGRGLADLRVFLLQEATGKDAAERRWFLSYALASGWPDERTLAALKLIMSKTAFKAAPLRAAARFMRHLPSAVNWIFEQASSVHPAEAEEAIALNLYDDRRALPHLMSVVKRNQAPYALRRLERYLHKPQVASLLAKIAASNRDANAQQLAADILQRRNIPLSPPPKKRAKRKKPTGPA
ncbi:MAG TPA: DUF4062 domain-containing protein [Thermoanaerobaculia bacterium]|jgi:hypothetical protein|nr:DUF4062 domain-containing protein [Thermoanaerobaculia bacterium]